MTYNMTPIYDGNTTIEIIDGFIKVAGGVAIFNFLIFFIYIIVLMVYGRDNIAQAAIGAGFVSGVVSVILFALGWVSAQIYILPLILLMISILIYKFTE